ncbi:MAG TPA: nitrogenase-stabilizing/protective protein NifW [Anaeromyxobacter sp.]
MTAPVPPVLPELAGLSEAEEFFEALGVRHDPRVLDAHRLHVLKTFGLAVESWLAANPEADAPARRRAIARALREAHDVFAEERRGEERQNPFAPGLVQLRRRT